MRAYLQGILFAFLGLLLCGILTACHAAEAEAPKEQKNTEAPGSSPDILSPAQEENAAPAALSPYTPTGPGIKDLPYNDQLEIYIQEFETQLPDGRHSTVGALMYRDLSTGNDQALDWLPYSSDHTYWDDVRLYPFTGIMGYDGFIFEHPAGVAYRAYDFYAVYDDAPILVAECNNAMYTADLDGDGQLELLSNYHNQGYLDLFWGEGYGFSGSCSLNETARDFLGLHPGRDWVELCIQEEADITTARWESDGGNPLTETVDVAALWEWEKKRTEFWDAVTLYTDDGRMYLVLLKERKGPSTRYTHNIEEVQVYKDDTLIQTISTADLSYDGAYLFEGLYNLRKDFTLGGPVVQDFNFDGSDDLGLLASSFFLHNVPYCYFLWDQDAGKLSTDFFILTAPLELDEENRQMIEAVNNGNEGCAYHYYQFDGSNQPVLVKQEIFTYQDAPVELDQMWCTTFELVDGELVQTSRELRKGRSY